MGKKDEYRITSSLLPKSEDLKCIKSQRNKPFYFVLNIAQCEVDKQESTSKICFTLNFLISLQEMPSNSDKYNVGSY